MKNKRESPLENSKNFEGEILHKYQFFIDRNNVLKLKNFNKNCDKSAHAL